MCAGVRENAPNFDEKLPAAAARSSPHAVSPRVIRRRRRRRSSSNELISKVNLQNDKMTSALTLLTVKGAF
jgi:hypothetical protein